MQLQEPLIRMEEGFFLIRERVSIYLLSDLALSAGTKRSERLSFYFCVAAALVRAKSDGFERLSSMALLRLALNADCANPSNECGKAGLFVWLALNANRAIPDVI